MSNRFPLSVAGRIATDPELSTGQSGSRTAFRLAVDDRVRDPSGHWSTAQTVFHDVVVWGRLAEAAAEQLAKGDPIVLSGEIRYRTWTADDGTIRTSSAIHADALGPDLRLARVQVDRERTPRRVSLDASYRAAAPAHSAEMRPAAI